MATPYAAEYVTLGGLVMRSRAIDCYDWSALRGPTEKRILTRKIGGQAGVEFRGATVAEIWPILKIKLDGSYDQDNNIVATTDAARIANLWVLLAALRAVVDVTTVQTLTLTTASTTYTATDAVAGDLEQVEKLSPWSFDYRLRLLLPSGPLAP